MITAKEARERVEKLISEDQKAEMQLIEEKIERAINDKKRFCTMDIRITDESKSTLEAEPLKYEVERSSFRGESSTTIRW